MDNVRVRFAPSPTGSLHIGGARTALFNWLFARHHNGEFILRIDDTDIERSVEQYTEDILASLRWLGLEWDEGPDKGGSYGPYLQSQRLDLYRREATKLLREGKAYPCFCTAEELEAVREKCRKEGKPPRYNGKCRILSPEDIKKKEKAGKKPVIRLKVPTSGETRVNDIIKGTVTFENTVFDDFIILKSNDMPTYNFACVIDDFTMQITHVIRAEEHLSNTPKQILIARALGYTLPRYAHVPMILAPDRSKLSKRHGATSVEEFRQQGYLSEAIVNYLALLGWSPPNDEEIIPIEKIIELFSLERVSTTAAIYDTKKLTWINAHYMREIDLDRLTENAIPFLQKAGLVPEQITAVQKEYIKLVVATTRDRARTLVELADTASYFFTDDFTYDQKGVNKHFKKDGVINLLRQAVDKLFHMAEPFTAENIEKIYRKLSEDQGVPAARIIHPTRLSISGRTVGPGLFDIMEVLGKDKTIERLNKAISYLESKKE